MLCIFFFHLIPVQNSAYHTFSAILGAFPCLVRVYRDFYTTPSGIIQQEIPVNEQFSSNTLYLRVTDRLFTAGNTFIV